MPNQNKLFLDVLFISLLWNISDMVKYKGSDYSYSFKEKDSEKDNSIKKQNSVERRKIHQKYLSINKSEQRILLKENVQEISGKNEITKAEQQFVDQYIFRLVVSPKNCIFD